MKRRDFITLLSSAAVAWPFAARAQQPAQMRRIGVLMNRAADDPEGQAGVAAFQTRLEQLGWSDGRNVQIDTRWGEDDIDRERKYAAELVALSPDIQPLCAGPARPPKPAAGRHRPAPSEIRWRSLYPRPSQFRQVPFSPHR
jgi:hypothetical protein